MLLRSGTDAGVHAAPPPRSSGMGDDVSRVVIVDDDPGLRELLTEFLVSNGLGAEAVESGAALRRRLQQRRCDVVILDMMMPGEDGLSVLRSLMRMEDRPGIIMFSAVSTDVDRIVALEMGADDYVLKPTAPREMLARVRAVLRRRVQPIDPSAGIPGGDAGSEGVRGSERYAFAGCVLDCRMRTLSGPGGVAVSISDSEYRMLALFVDDPQTVHSRERLATLAGKPDPDIKDRSVDVSVSRLRRKLSAATGEELIRTVRNQGYLFVPEVRMMRP